tara:strand:- start:1737 stop:2327 length:591 start_codon:yes stop_codon:yes gene_type:complete
MKTVILAILIAITACATQAKHRPLQIGLETGLETGFQETEMKKLNLPIVAEDKERFNKRYKNMIIGAKVGYEIQLNDRFSVTPIAHFGTSLDNNKIKTKLELKRYVEFGAKFSAYDNAEQRVFFYVEPNYRYQKMNLTSNKTKTNGHFSLKNEGMGVKLGVGRFITDNVMIDLSASRHWMEDEDVSHILLGVSYAL